MMLLQYVGFAVLVVQNLECGKKRKLPKYNCGTALQQRKNLDATDNHSPQRLSQKSLVASQSSFEQPSIGSAALRYLVIITIAADVGDDYVEKSVAYR